MKKKRIAKTTTAAAPSPSGWTAVANLMPPGPATLHVHGPVWLPSSCHTARLTRDPGTVTAPEILALKCELVQKPTPPGGVCLPVLLPAQADWSLKNYPGGRTHVRVGFADGSAVLVPITEAH
jgi:hypothetical protein